MVYVTMTAQAFSSKFCLTALEEHQDLQQTQKVFLQSCMTKSRTENLYLRPLLKQIYSIKNEK